jgi:hypothetical protein
MFGNIFPHKTWFRSTMITHMFGNRIYHTLGIIPQRFHGLVFGYNYISYKDYTGMVFSHMKTGNSLVWDKQL